MGTADAIEVDAYLERLVCSCVVFVWQLIRFIRIRDFGTE